MAFPGWSALFLLLFLPTAAVAEAGPAETAADRFLSDAFTQGVPPPKLLWLTGERRATAEMILGHAPRAMRIRYRQADGRTAWILEEIGKEELITVGLLVSAGRIERLRVLTYRESRGGEIQHDYFTRQFEQAGLSDDLKLDRRIDGISGATLSVRALTRLARLALYYDGQLDPD
ncbi:MAG: FMN-binding protein [Gammaproteobacteria bacterium]|nr:FMN-binding protein [Gammaproteobacteria bacterium]